MTDNDIPSIRDVFVGQIMTETVETISSERTATEAAAQLFESGIGSLLVDADPGPPGGIITETDFVELAATKKHPAKTTVADCMSSPVTTVDESTRLEDAAELMSENDVKKLPVVGKSGGSVGIVTTTDIAKYLPVHEFHPEE